MLDRTKEERSRKSKTTLGKYLASIRKDRGLTLRQVEEASEREVSNAYLRRTYFMPSRRSTRSATSTSWSWQAMLLRRESVIRMNGTAGWPHFPSTI